MHFVSGIFVGLGALIAIGHAAPTGLTLTGLGRAASQNLHNRIPVSRSIALIGSSFDMDPLVVSIIEKFRITSKQTQSTLSDLHSQLTRSLGKQEGLSRYNVSK